MEGKYKQSMYDTVLSAAKQHGCRAETNAPMRNYTTFKVGGPADLLVAPDSSDALSDILKACRKDGIRPQIIGRGSNVLVPDEGLRGVVILMGEDFSKVEYCGSNMVRAQAGATVIKLCRFALDYNLGGLEFAYGIPGSVGGAVYMNAGAYGGEMKNVVMVVEHMDYNGEKGSWQGEKQLGFSYRHSNYMDADLIVTSVIFYLNHSDPDAIKLKMDGLMDRRKAKQPLEYPSAGSTFKRPEGYFAGALIEQCGLRGKIIGGAQVSEKHCGFIINRGNATANDIKELIRYVQDTVEKQTGVHLEPEVRML